MVKKDTKSVKTKTAKARSGKWFRATRGSYVPVAPEGWLMHAVLLLAGVMVIALAMDDNRSVLIVLTSMLLQLIGLAGLFSVIAAKRS